MVSLGPTARWRAALLGTLTPLLLLGFGASALANRLVFAGWGLAAAAVLVPVLRRSFELWLGRAGGGARIAAAAAFVLGPALALFAWLADRHQEILDLGARAVFPGLYTPAATAPATHGALAALCLAVGVGCRLAHRSAARRDRAARAVRTKEGAPWPESAS
jgi:hypothetical protein